MGQPHIPLCPSAPPDLEGSVLIGVVGGSREPGVVAYLAEPQPVTADLLAHAGPLRPQSVFRFAAPCQAACAHRDGADCRLGRKIVDLLPPVVEVLPPCAIRSRCRWWGQEGRAACMRCPAIATEPSNATDSLRRAADPEVLPR